MSIAELARCPGFGVSGPLRDLLRGDAEAIGAWLDVRSVKLVWLCSTVIVAGCGIYGATFGLWRAPLQALYSAVKFPMVIFLTCAGNALLNGMMAQLLGSGMSFRKTSLSILLSFTLASLILAACSPVMLFLLWNTPSTSAGELGHAITLVFHVGMIALAGVVANVRLLRLIQHQSVSSSAAYRTLFAWLAGNLLLGSQVAWILRPFAGSPTEPVLFLSPEPLRGNFFEAIGGALLSVLHG